MINRSLIRKTRKGGFRGGIHLCYPRYTEKQKEKDLDWYDYIVREERAEQIDTLGMGYEI